MAIALTEQSTAAEFSVAEARQVVQDLFEPKPFIYWIDFLASMTVGALSLIGSRWAQVWFGPSPFVLALQALLFATTCVAFYRAALFTHELTHLPSKGFASFRIAWNALFGIPYLMPSFLYHIHVAHHRRQHYATAQDGEYLPWASEPPREIVKYLAESLIIPLLAIVRFMVLTPASWLSPRFRRWLQQRASSMIIDPSYVRPLPTKNEQMIWRLQEGACLGVIVYTIVLFAIGFVPWTLLPHAYAIAVCIVFLNAVRTLVAHRYRNIEGEMTFLEQYRDSINYPYNPLLSELWAPVGLRYHALHHLFPSMPYHALAKAHRRLMAHFPADSPYCETISPGLWASLRQLWSESRSCSLEDRTREVGGGRPHGHSHDRNVQRISGSGRN